MTTGQVKRSRPNGIEVLIAGAGVGGLMTALECWRQGCRVRILERSPHNITSGDSFTIGPTAINTFKHWPFLMQKNREIAYHPLLAYHKPTGERMIGPFELRDMVSKDVEVEDIYRHSRPRFHAMMLEQLAQVGIAVEYGKEVNEYFEDEQTGRAGIVLKDGSREDADLVVEVDGVGGKSWSLVARHPVPARSSGNAIFRAAYPVKVAVADPMVADFFPMLHNGRSVIELWVGPGMHAAFWRNEDEMTYSITHPDHGTAAESWGHKVDPDEVWKFTSTIPGWPEVANRVIRLTPLDLLLGDAAHTFLPSSGNGGTQAIEDAASLAACLDIAGSKDQIPEALRVHNLLRFQRVSCLQAFGVVNSQKHSTAMAAEDIASQDTEGRKSEKKSDEAKGHVVHLGRWMMAHDPEAYAYEMYDKALAHLMEGAPFQNTSTPPGMVYRPWTIDGLVEAHEKGEPTVLDGDWE